jgi:hypothetical protein
MVDLVVVDFTVVQVEQETHQVLLHHKETMVDQDLVEQIMVVAVAEEQVL